MLPEDTPNPPEGYKWKEGFLTKTDKTKKRKPMNFAAATSKMKPKDWMWLMGTLAIAASNKHHRGGQAEVIQHNLDKSKELGLSTAKSALSRVKNYVLPKLQKNEEDVISMRDFIMTELKGVDPRIINALIKAGPETFNRFKTELAETKKYMQKKFGQGTRLSGDQINKMFPGLATMDTDVPMGFATTASDKERLNAVNKLLDSSYRGHRELLDASNTPEEFEGGLFGAMYGDPKASLRETANYLRMAGTIPIGDRIYDYNQLDQLDSSRIGMPTGSETAIPGGFDTGTAIPREFNEKIMKQLSDRLEGLVGNWDKAKLGDVFDENPLFLGKAWGDLGFWDGETDSITNSNLEPEDKTKAKTIAPRGGIYQFIHKEAIRSDIENGTLKTQANLKSLQAQMATLISNTKDIRASQQDTMWFTFINESLKINKDTTFADRDNAKLFISLVGGYDQGVLRPDDQIKYYDDDGGVTLTTVRNLLGQ